MGHFTASHWGGPGGEFVPAVACDTTNAPLTIWAGVEFHETFVVSVPVSWTKILFTAKEPREVDDEDALWSIFQVQLSLAEDGDGLLVLNRSAVDTGDADNGYITLATDLESIDLRLSAWATKQLSSPRVVWDIGIHTSADLKPFVSAPAEARIRSVVTRTLPA